MKKLAQWHRKIISIGMLILVSACSSAPTVHVFPHYLSKAEKEKVVVSLAKAEFNVEISEQVPPLNIAQNSIVFTPMVESDNTINELMAILAGVGFEVSSANLIFSGNHSFSQNNLGVYLFPNDFVPPVSVHSIPIASEYMGDNCAYSNTLTLHENRQFTLLVEQWNDATDRYDESNYKGFWSREDADTIQLRFSNKARMSFARSIKLETDRNGARKRVRLSPVSLSGNLDENTLKCSYSIALVL